MSSSPKWHRGPGSPTVQLPVPGAPCPTAAWVLGSTSSGMGASTAAGPNHGWPHFGAALGSPLSTSLGASLLWARARRGHGCGELRAVSARWRGAHTWPRSRRGRPPAVPRSGGARGALAPRRRPHELRGRAFSAFSLPSQPHSQVHPILAALQNKPSSLPGWSGEWQRAAGSRGGLLPASLLTPGQPRRSCRPRVPGSDFCCLLARGGKPSYIDLRGGHARSRERSSCGVGSHGGAAAGSPGSRRPSLRRGAR